MMHNVRARLRKGAAVLCAVLLFTSVSLPISALAEAANGTNTDQPQTTTVTLPAVAVPAPVATEPASPTAPATSTNTTPVPAPSLSATVSTASPTLATTTSATPSQTLSNPDQQPASTTGTGSTANSTAVKNTVDGSATSGDASVHDNYKAGNATSGSSNATATIVNAVNSSSSLGNDGNYTYYNQNIDAGQTMQGNILIDPSSLTPVSGIPAQNGTIQNTSSMADILNNIILNAASGDATVSDNHQAGNATSGDATAIANIINLVNSQIGAKQTFLGVINIYGNLEGDILVPNSFVDSLMDTTAAAAGNSSAHTSNTTVTNNVETNATSGDATVKDNYQAGNATSGDATTSLTVFNLTGQQVIAKNSLLVFVNVLGKWVGMIVNQPGATTAALTGGVSSSTGAGAVGSNDSQSVSDTTITNNIKVNATSGDATVKDNYQAGNATSGKAQAGANILNMTNTSFAMDDWFGVLFINVLGTWLGSFGIDTPAVPTNSDGTPSEPIVREVKAFRLDEPATFTPKAPATSTSNRTPSITPVSATEPTPPETTATSRGNVLGDSTTTPSSAVARFDVISLVMVVIALTGLLAAGSWTVRRFAKGH